MERRFFFFVVFACLLLVAHALIVELVLPPPAKPKPLAKDAAAKKDDREPAKVADGSVPTTDKTAGSEDEKKTDSGQPDEPRPPDAPTPELPEYPHQVVALGSYAVNSPYNLHVTLNSRGAALECVELTERTPKGELRFRELDAPHGYLGYLALTEFAGGCRVNVVGAGTPAAEAACQSPNVERGLRAGDVIQEVQIPKRESVKVTRPSFDALLEATKPNDEITLVVLRETDGKSQTLKFVTRLAVRPLEIIHPEPSAGGGTDPLSCLLALAPTESLTDESPALSDLAQQLRDRDWEVQVLAGQDPAVEFRSTFDYTSTNAGAARGKIEVVKRYRIHPRTPDGAARASYHIDLELEFHNRGEQLQLLSYRLDGPNGLPLEGWWYMTKIHPTSFQGAGARDIVCKTTGEGRRLLGLPGIFDAAKKRKDKDLVLFAEGDPKKQEVNFLGVDTQYFLAALTPVPEPSESSTAVRFRHARAKLISDPAKVTKDYIRTANSTFELVSLPFNVEPGKSHVVKFELFTGPKQKQLLEAYHLEDTIAYGWFAMVVKPLSWLVHQFHWLTGNWGIAIVMLTVFVRGCMFPMSRKAAANAQMMQQLAPEMKKITEKYKTDMEKRAIAQRELFRQYNYNPLSGCWMVFLQLPVFVGLYRCLAIDVDLRQAALIPGIQWCSNLAGPDKLFLWKPFLPGFLANETGWLGPFFNFLPCITIALFLIQQKMFTPPATDEQTQMQLTVMKYMTVVMGVFFYKVPGGLCVYFIMSSLWSIGERKLVPKPKVELKTVEDTPGKPRKESFIERILRMAEEANKANERNREADRTKGTDRKSAERRKKSR